VIPVAVEITFHQQSHENQPAGDAGISRPNTWPARSVYTGRWCHSDLKDVAYFYVFKFYEKVIEKGGLR